MHLPEVPGWWNKTETMLTPKVGFMLTDKITNVAVTYFGNSKNVKVPAADNWCCIAQGLYALGGFRVRV